MTSEYSRYTGHDSSKDFLNIDSQQKTGKKANNKDISFDFVFNPYKFILWMILFFVAYLIQPLVIWNFLPDTIKKFKEGLDRTGTNWTEESVASINKLPNVMGIGVNETFAKSANEKLANELNYEGTTNATENIVGSELLVIFTIAIFTFIFGNWNNSISFNKTGIINIICLLFGWIISTGGLEIAKSFIPYDIFIAKAERYINYRIFKKDNYNIDLSYTHYWRIGIFALIFILIFLVPYILGVVYTEDMGIGSYYNILVLINFILFICVPLWDGDKLKFSLLLRGLAIILLLMIRKGDWSSFLYGGLAIGIISSESHWSTSKSGLSCNVE
jgi:hypothetical protein